MQTWGIKNRYVLLPLHGDKTAPLTFLVFLWSKTRLEHHPVRVKAAVWELGGM